LAKLDDGSGEPVNAGITVALRQTKGGNRSGSGSQFCKIFATRMVPYEADEANGSYMYFTGSAKDTAVNGGILYTDMKPAEEIVRR
jgi:hypothetical protein